MDCEELDWGNEVHVGHIKETYPDGFDLILGADIYILFREILQSDSAYAGRSFPSGLHNVCFTCSSCIDFRINELNWVCGLSKFS